MSRQSAAALDTSHTPMEPANRAEKRAKARADKRAKAPVAHARAANDATPSWSLTADARARLTTEALALAPAALPRALPTHITARVEWLARIHTLAWNDRATLTRVSFGLAPVTEAELREMGLCIAFLRDVVTGRGLDAPTPVTADTAQQMTDKQLAAALRGCHVPLCRALTRRFKNAEPGPALKTKREAVQSVRRYRGLSGLGRCNTRLLKLCDDAEVAAWLPTLPRGEGVALARLKTLDAEWQRRAKARHDAPKVPDTMPLRAWALATVALARVLEAGRYLVEDDPTRSRDYKPFKSRSRKAPKPATKPTPPTG